MKIAEPCVSCSRCAGVTLSAIDSMVSLDAQHVKKRIVSDSRNCSAKPDGDVAAQSERERAGQFVLVVHPDLPRPRFRTRLELNAVSGTNRERLTEHRMHVPGKLPWVHAPSSRDAEVCEIQAEQVFSANVRWLQPESSVPTDVRLRSTQGLKIHGPCFVTGVLLAVGQEHPAAVGERVSRADGTNRL